MKDINCMDYEEMRYGLVNPDHLYLILLLNQENILELNLRVEDMKQ